MSCLLSQRCRGKRFCQMPNGRSWLSIIPNVHDLGSSTCPADFESALKELDGTFIATRKVENSVLVRFQNPSIRDFMQNLLLSGELLTEILESLVFFEQARWFADTLREEHSRVHLKELEHHADKVLGLLKEMFEVEAVLLVTGYQQWQRIAPQPVNPC